jgi:uncharacterized protein (DUF1778 family)
MPSTPPEAPGNRASINLRIEPEARRLIDEAAAALGKTRTEFMIDSARREAIDVLLDRRLFTLADADFDAFAKSLDAAPAPDAKLRALMSRVPAWRR